MVEVFFLIEFLVDCVVVFLYKILLRKNYGSVKKNLCMVVNYLIFCLYIKNMIYFNFYV